MSTMSVRVAKLVSCGAAALIAGVALSSVAAPAGQTAPAAAPKRQVYHPAYLDLPPPAVPLPDWAFTRDPPETADLQRQADDDVPRHVPNSTLALTRTHVLNHNDAADWHPDNHPAAPSIVMFGHKPQPAACGFCHLPNGQGAPENAPLAGLPVNYFIQQVHDFQTKDRKTADMRMASWHGMSEWVAPKITEEDLKTAATYFAGLKLKPYLKVVEVTRVPKTHSVGYTLLPVPGGGTEPIGNRVIETPMDVERFHLNDSESGYMVYVPRGSIKRGEKLAKTGDNGRTMACVACHGADLLGVGDVPPIAGRGPSNLARQLYNFKRGARAAPDAELMLPVVKDLTDRDIVDVIAYASSRKPS